MHLDLPFIQVFIIIPKSKPTPRRHARRHAHRRLLLISWRVMATGGDRFGLGHVDRLRTRTRTPQLRPGEQEHNTTTTRLLGALGAGEGMVGGKLGRDGRRVSPNSSERGRPWALSESSKVKGWPLYCTCPEER